MIIKCHQMEFPQSWIIQSVNKLCWGESLCDFWRLTVTLPQETGSGRLGGTRTEDCVLMGLHSVSIRTQSPWIFGCRFLFVVTYGCLSTAAVALTLISPLSAASVARIVQSHGQLLEREARHQERELARNQGGPWPAWNCPCTCTLEAG